jgi:hypothetical protein
VDTPFSSAGASRGDRGPDGLKAGDVLDASNWKDAEGLLPPEVLKHYETGEYAR